MNILAIETSCDETAVALLKAEKNSFAAKFDLVSSQVKIHSPFGGVVPNLAAREHLKNLPTLLKKTIKENQLGPENIDLIAVTQGPGLIPALLIGTNSAKALAYTWKKPLVGVHHVAGHIYANFIDANPNSQISKSKLIKKSVISFPVLALIVSGGHTQLILMRKHMDFKIIGETLDDAAGEAFDKVAKILNLGYPGGPTVAAHATKFSIFDFRFSNNFKLPRPMINSKNLNFSFSGLKTAVLYTVKKNPEISKDKKLIAALCAEFQQAVIDVLVSKTLKAAKKYKPKTILLGGGVSANQELRNQLKIAIEKNLPNTRYQIPDTRYSLDNAVMIAIAGYHQYKLTKNKKKLIENWKNLEANAGLSLSSCTCLTAFGGMQNP